MKFYPAIKMPLPSLGEGHAFYLFECPCGKGHPQWFVAREGASYRPPAPIEATEYPSIHIEHVWGTKTEGAQVTITPSLNAEKSCGWHGPYTWGLFVQGEAKTRNEAWKLFDQW